MNLLKYYLLATAIFGILVRLCSLAFNKEESPVVVLTATLIGLFLLDMPLIWFLLNLNI